MYQLEYWTIHFLINKCTSTILNSIKSKTNRMNGILTIVLCPMVDVLIFGKMWCNITEKRCWPSYNEANIFPRMNYTALHESCNTTQSSSLMYCFVENIPKFFGSFVETMKWWKLIKSNWWIQSKMCKYLLGSGKISGNDVGHCFSKRQSKFYIYSPAHFDLCRVFFFVCAKLSPTILNVESKAFVGHWASKVMQWTNNVKK